MKKALSFVVALSICVCLCSCGQVPDEDSIDSPAPTPEQAVSNTPSFQESKIEPSKQYVGNYEVEPVYQKLYEIETCTNPEQLLSILSNLYGEEFSYIKMEWTDTGEGHLGYKEPYEDFLCQVTCFYDTDRIKAPVSSETFVFFREYNETPSFIMDEDGTYLVRDYEIKNFDDGTNCHNITAWICSDLYMCLHGHIEDDAEGKKLLSDAVRYMDFYLDFENLIIDYLGDLAENVSKIESLNPSIEILSVEVCGPTMHELMVNYQIRNISDERGTVYLTCSGHAYQDQLWFNDENHKNDYRDDGCYSYNVFYGGHGQGSETFTINYGYGTFDIYDGWSKSCVTTMRILYIEDYGEISSDTIPAEEIHPLYFEGEYVGAWTTYESGDLIEINGNSLSIPFETNHSFQSDSGHAVSVVISDGTPLFTVNGIYVGAPTDTYEYDGTIDYDLFYDGYFSITRYPNDEYIRLQNADFIGAYDVYLYP
ncbi:MAG: hypothetical protein HDT20_00205 [Oscillibacter sp.]|nr:hypothetical protein [Oscillibacter sp.]